MSDDAPELGQLLMLARETAAKRTRAGDAVKRALHAALIANALAIAAASCSITATRIVPSPTHVMR